MQVGEGTTVRIEDLFLSFPQGNGRLPVIDGLSMKLEAGEFVSLVGPSGCGKSTFLRVINGLLKPDSGRVFIGDQEVVGVPGAVGMVFQNDALLPWHTVTENIRLALVMRKVSPKQHRPRLDELLELMGLEAFANHMPGTLSGGMRKRVALARALAYDSDIFLMDEPFGPLDAQTRIRVGQEFLRIWNNVGKSVLFVTHDIEEAIAISDRVVVLSHRPARIVDEFVIDLPRPRDFYEIRFESRFQELHKLVYHSLTRATASQPTVVAVG